MLLSIIHNFTRLTMKTPSGIQTFLEIFNLSQKTCLIN